MSITKKCPVGCNDALQRSDIVLPEGPLLKCNICGQLVNPCDKETYEKRFRPFDNDNPIDRNPSAHLKRLRRVKRHSNFPPSETRLLDIGCNIGTFLELARAQGYLITGVEPDANAALTGIRSGLDIRCGHLHEMRFGKNCYDVITLFEVIEHLEDPAGLLKECHRVLKRGGFLFITNGNTWSWTVMFLKHRWDYFNLKLGHISFFNPSSISTLAKNTGFEAVKIETKSVSLQDRGSVTAVEYRIAKMAAGVLCVVARLLNKGHDMFVVLKKKGEPYQP